jgi:hypothetical protein
VKCLPLNDINLITLRISLPTSEIFFENLVDLKTSLNQVQKNAFSDTIIYRANKTKIFLFSLAMLWKYLVEQFRILVQFQLHTEAGTYNDRLNVDNINLPIALQYKYFVNTFCMRYFS